uniref:Transcriptional regulator, TetR family n=1 Tax=uncultured bacterium Contig19 TaxID=1393523 RepID=W0FGZ3_9BACT|nr:transcriptional regulator, TetR family [uncultured bacterium Contig19]
MAVYTKGKETKRQLVDLVYNMLRERDASTITAREVAVAHGCSAAAIYRHFESLEALISVASVRFLHTYMEEYSSLMDSDLPFLELYVEGWELFDRYAFERPDLYYRLFWGEENHNLGDAVQEYYELFPFEASKKSAAYFYTLMFNDDMVERDYLMLHRAVNLGLITDEEARYFSRSNNLIARGLIFDAMATEGAERGELREMCDSLIRENMRKVMA